MNKRLIQVSIFGMIWILLSVWGWSEIKRVYSLTPLLEVRAGEETNAKIRCTLQHGVWFDLLETKSNVLKIKTPDGTIGYIRNAQVTDTWIKVLKDERLLFLMQDTNEIRRYRIGLSFNPKDDKIKQGDGGTPEGRFYICEIIENPKSPEVYGPVSLRISYPNIEDARRGLKNKLISKAEYIAIVKAVHAGQMPPQNSALGGSIKIHGGNPGSSCDWTLGCMALDNPNIRELYRLINGKSVMVDIYRNKQQEQILNQKDYINRRTVEEALKLMKEGCLYTRSAVAIIPISFPMGDFEKFHGVCTDVVIRSLRGSNVDLQALLFEDILREPKRYPLISNPNPNIDHRRARNLKVFFDRHALSLTNDPPVLKPKEWQPGDIVIMDTGISNGTPFDHIGIVSPHKNGDGIPLVINLWSVGCKLNEMELLDGVYPKIVGHYRLFHPFYYNAM